MRRLVVALVLANLLMFGWNRGWFDGAGDLPSREENADRLRPVSLSRLEPPPSTPSSAPPSAPPNPLPDPAPAAAPVTTSTPADPSASSSALAVTPVVCRAFPLLDEERAAALRGALEQSGASVDERRIEQGASYLVYLPPAENSAQAQQRLVELRRIGRDDAFVIQDGPMRLAISLGLFRFESAARVMVDQLARAGETRAQIAPRPPIQVRIALQARWSQADAGAIATMLGAQFDAPARDCD